MTIFLTGCLTRQEIEATVWRTNGPIPPSICQREPALQKLGYKRTLDSGQSEFISFCKPCDSEGKQCVRDWLSIHERDVQRIIDELTPKPKDGK